MRAGFVFLLFLTQSAIAQFNYLIDQSVPVTLLNNEPLSLPWAGGLNASQFNTLDFNNDGRPDLAIYDRTSDRVITFVNDNNQYRYAPEYEPYFPSGITNWMLLRDYNGDGKKDIFSGDNLGIKVYTNITPPGEPLQWEQFYFTGIGSKSPVLLTTGFSGKINVQLNFDDLPAVSDADGDGDLDLFVPKYPGGATIEFHKNQSVENGEPLDSLEFARTPQTPQAWGGVTECNCGEFEFNNTPCNAGGREDHAGGKSLFAFDVDNDGDQDMLFTESDCTQLFLLRNEGTDAAPVINSAVNFPSGTPAVMVMYPTSFFEDVDFDGVKDLIVTPNVFAREYLQTNFRQSVWFYKNTGTTAQPTFNSSPIRNFLQRGMIDVGDNAVPAFFDADADGDLDLFIACYTYNFSGTIFYFENTGTQSLPSFKFITSDFMLLSSSNLINIKPLFADMNGDTRIDMAFTGTNRFSGATQLFYFPNSNGNSINFSQGIVSTGIFISASENICVADVNHDSKNDLLIGRQNGSLQYWKNTGTATNPDYTLEDDSFLEIGSSVLRQNLACTTADLDADGNTDLLMGDQGGVLTIINNYRDVANANDAVQNILFNSIGEEYIAQNMGGRVWPTVANIFKTDKPAIIVGNTQGGIHILKPEQSVLLSENPIIDVYPNPASKASSVITVKVDRPAGMLMLTALGQEVNAPVYLQAFQEYSFQIQGFSKGIYLLYFVVEGNTYTRKIAIH